MGNIEYLQRTIEYIEDHLKQPLTIDDCAQVACFSKYHFHRIFGMVVGFTLMEYVRKRRLYHAMVDVLQGKRILDIALDYGYNSERAFSRAFLQEFAQIPSQCRNIKYSIPPKPVLAEMIDQMNGGIAMDYLSDVRIGNLDEMTVASAVRISKDPEDEVIAYLNDWAEKTGVGAGARRFGFDVPISDEEQSNGLRGYEYWVVVEQAVDVPDDVQLKKVEGCKYAILRITDPFANPFERIPAGWKQLVAWVDSKGYKTSRDRERYWLEEVVEVDGKVYMDVYFPIE